MIDDLKIGDEVYVHGYVDEIRKDTVIIRNDGGFFGTEFGEVITKTEHTGWHPGDDPPESGSYFVTKVQSTGQRIMTIGNYYKPAHDWTGNGNFKNVIAWRPLPEEYKGSVGKEIKKC